MQVLLAGGSGYLGSGLTQALLARGNQVTILSRSPHPSTALPQQGVRWMTWERFQEDSYKTPIDVAINLAGSTLATFPWTDRVKERLRSSRIATTQRLMAMLPSSCHRVLNASAIGIYPSSQEIFDETTPLPVPQSFLQRLCQAWEAATISAQAPRRQIVYLRTAVVRGEQGIAPLMRSAVKRGGGVMLGDGHQRIAYVTIDQWIERVLFLIDHPEIVGPVNLVSGNIRHASLMHLLATHYHRLLRGGVPEKIVRAIAADASALVLDSHHIVSQYFSQVPDESPELLFPDQ